MATHIGLLRGINVGKAKRVAMADLRALVSELGYGNPRTLLNSGNVLFDAPGVAPAQAAARIEGALEARVGFSARVMVITTHELERAVAENPLVERAGDPSRLMVGFVGEPGHLKRVEPLLGEEWAPEALALGSVALYLWCPEGIIASRLAQGAGRALGDNVTLRNWTTVTKLAALAAGPA